MVGRKLMGLDIGAYKNVKVLDNQAMFDCDGELLEGFESVKYAIARHNRDFPGRADDIEDRKAYAYEDYQSFRACSYGGYNQWRETLAKIAGYPNKPYKQYETIRDSHANTVWSNPVPGPFMEIINFSDCEGIIGTKVSQKLFKDFVEYDEKAKEEDEYFYRIYCDFKSAFESASENGRVDFH